LLDRQRAEKKLAQVQRVFPENKSLDDS
jgi:hypothetical protein